MFQEWGTTLCPLATKIAGSLDILACIYIRIFYCMHRTFSPKSFLQDREFSDIVACNFMRRNRVYKERASIIIHVLRAVEGRIKNPGAFFLEGFLTWGFFPGGFFPGGFFSRGLFSRGLLPGGFFPDTI